MYAYIGNHALFPTPMGLHYSRGVCWAHQGSLGVGVGWWVWQGAQQAVTHGAAICRGIGSAA